MGTCGWLLAVLATGCWLLWLLLLKRVDRQRMKSILQGVWVVVVVAVCVYVETADGYCSGAGCGTLASALNGKQQYKKDDQAVVFIEVTNTASNTTQRAPFFPQVDEFSVLEIPDSGSLFYRNESITVSVVMGNDAHATPPRAYTDGTSFVGYYSALVHMRNGRILRIEWDEGCSGCPDGCVWPTTALSPTPPTGPPASTQSAPSRSTSPGSGPTRTTRSSPPPLSSPQTLGALLSPPSSKTLPQSPETLSTAP